MEVLPDCASLFEKLKAGEDSGFKYEGLEAIWPTCSKPTFAYTVAMDPSRRERGADQITICPWFLAYELKKKFHTLDGHETSSGLLSTFVGQLAAKSDEWVAKLAYTKVDLFALFEKVMLHEVRWLSDLAKKICSYPAR